MKYLPIVFGIDVKDNFPIFFGSFYKFAYYAYKNNWPIIAQEEYFKDPDYYEKKYNINLNSVFKINEIKEVDSKKQYSLNKYIITKEVTDKVIEEFENIDRAWINLMNKKSNVLYDYLKKQLRWY